MSKPEAEIDISVALVRELLRVQHPDMSRLSITAATSGWDNAIFRLGEELAARLPRRGAAVTCLENEQRWLPLLSQRLPLPVPAPIRFGKPQEPYPWRWSVTPWIAGETAARSAPDRDQAVVLAAFFEALHTRPPEDAPRNPHRSGPLSEREARFVRSIETLATRGRSIDPRLLEIWSNALERPIDIPPTWIHADLHAHNVLVAHGRITGVIDWGDVAQGDRATDLAAVWTLLPERDAREQVIAACKSVSSDTWRRARGWALLLSLIVLESEDPAHLGPAERTLQRLLDGP